MNNNNGGDQGIVFQKNLGQYSVHCNGRDIACGLSPRLLNHSCSLSDHPGSLGRAVQAVDEIEQVAIGDAVRFADVGDGRGLITQILPRRNKFSRLAVTAGRRRSEQVIAANVHQVVAVLAAARPALKWGLLDRYLVAAGSAGLPVLICITKTDLADEGAELEATLADYRRIGYDLCLASVVTGEGLDELKQTLRGRVSVLVGTSGVGKTSLLNAVQPGLGLRVGAVSEGKQGKGMHTTTRLEMFPLEGGGAVIDTPGVREFGMWDVPRQDLALFFPEMRPLVGRCKFGLDCRHDEEPGCAIRKAVTCGEISPYRYQSYLKLRVMP